MKRAWFIAIAVLALAGCKAQDVAAAKKFDAPLRLKADQLQQSGQHETISLLGKCSRTIDDAMKSAITKTGATLLSANADIFTATVPSERLLKLASLDFVTQLQLSQVSQPSSP